MASASGEVVAKDFLDVTEITGAQVASEQVERLYHRYQWAADLCRGRDVLEIACGSGQGLGLLLASAGSVRAADISAPLVEMARRTYADRLPIDRAGAEATGLEDASIDSIVLFEAIYYLPDIDRFLEECERILRPGGQILIATANKDLYDFSPSPHATRYYGVRELSTLFARCGYDVRVFGYMPVARVSWRQRVLRPIKMLVVRFGLMPKTMRGKELLKRLVFGRLVTMPAELVPGQYVYQPPDEIAADEPDTRHKVIYCVATRKNELLRRPE